MGFSRNTEILEEKLTTISDKITQMEKRISPGYPTHYLSAEIIGLMTDFHTFFGYKPKIPPRKRGPEFPSFIDPRCYTHESESQRSMPGSPPLSVKQAKKRKQIAEDFAEQVKSFDKNLMEAGLKDVETTGGQHYFRMFDVLHHHKFLVESLSQSPPSTSSENETVYRDTQRLDAKAGTGRTARAPSSRTTPFNRSSDTVRQDGSQTSDEASPTDKPLAYPAILQDPRSAIDKVIHPYLRFVMQPEFAQYAPK